MSLREEQCKKVCRILDDVLANRPTERDSLIVAVQLAFEALSEPHWIPVERALPELRHDVLLTVFFHEKWNVTEGYRQDGEFMFWNYGRLDSVLDEENRVIAWMPKPEPYKGSEE